MKYNVSPWTRLKHNAIGLSTSDRLELVMKVIDREGRDILHGPVIATKWNELFINSQEARLFMKGSPNDYKIAPSIIMATILGIQPFTFHILTAGRFEIPTEKEDDLSTMDSCVFLYDKSYVFVTADDVIEQFKRLSRLGEKTFTELFTTKVKQRLGQDFQVKWRNK